MSTDSLKPFYEETLEMSFSGYLIVPADLLEHPSDPPSPNLRPVRCSDESCGFVGEADIAFGQETKGLCPDCGSEIETDFMRMTWGIGSRGPGFHSTKFGARRKKDMIRKNEKLAKTQWENVNPGSVVNPDRVVNPTEGGVFDPNSKFNAHKKKPGSTTTFT